MGRWSLLLAVLLCGCAVVKRDLYHDPFCYPKAKYKREQKQYYVGVKCVF